MVTIQPDGKVTHHAKCQFCQKPSKVQNIPYEGYSAWRAGELIQNVLPDLSADEREILISGTHPACWDAMWDFSDE